ncbi:MAG: hypothetical protein JOZ51_10920, partial [Chloroflexi bacterium]|nr:hypothetical protein [Chloroflexota bacterium]
MSSTITPFSAAQTTSNSSALSALSPAAYLVDLVDFMLDSFATHFANPQELARHLHRPLEALVLDRAAVEQPVLQIQIAIEVLEHSILNAEHTLNRSQLYARFTDPVLAYPKPNALGRVLDAYLTALQTSRTEIAAAFAAAYPGSGTGDRAKLSALLERLHLAESDLTASLGLSGQQMATLPALKPTIDTVEKLPPLVRASLTHAIDRDDPLQLPAYADALARAETAISRAQEYTLADVRENLIHAFMGAPANPKWAGNQLYVDLSASSSNRTTRIADAIEAIHAFVLAFQLGDKTATLSVIRVDFDARWRWMQSYSLWHAAQSVFLYSEDFLMARTRRNLTPEFQTFLDALESQTTPTAATQAAEQYRRQALGNWRRTFDHACVFENKLFLFETFFGYDGQRQWGEIHYATLDEFGNWEAWRPVPFPQDALNNREPLDIKVAGDKILMILSIHEIDKTTIEAYSWNGTGEAAVRDNWSKSYSHNNQQAFYRPAVVLDAMPGDYQYVAAAHITFETSERKRVVNTLYRSASGRWSEYYSWINGDKLLEVNGSPLPGAMLGSRHYFLLREGDAPKLVSVYRVDPAGLRPASMRVDSIVEVPIDAYTCTVDGGRVVLLRSSGSSVEYVTYDPDAEEWSDPQALPIGEHGTGYAVVSGDKLTLYGSSGLSEYRRQSTAPLSYRYEGTRRTMVPNMWRGIKTSRPINASAGTAAFQQYQEEQRLLFATLNPRDLTWLYVEEYYMHVPLAAAEYLNQQQFFQEADTWLHLLYHPFLHPELRLVYLGLSRPGDPGDSYRDTVEWLRDPFNPFTIGRIRHQAFLRHVVQRHIENMLDWADAEFVRDTSESIGRARELYELAEDVLGLGAIPQHSFEQAWRSLSTQIFATFDNEQIRVLELLLNPVRSGERLATVDDVQSFAAILRQERPFAERANLLKQAIDALGASAAARTLDQTLGDLRKGSVKDNTLALALQAAQIDGTASADDERALLNGDLPETLLAQAASPEMWLVEMTLARIGGEFSVPENPILQTLRWRIEANLEKIRENRNYAGMRRALQSYAAPADPLSLVQQAASGEFADEGIPNEPPPVYRFSYLIERARYFVSTAQQLEALLLASFEKGDEQEYTLLKARQDLRAAQANITLQSLRIKESSDGVELARRQRHRAEIQSGYFEDLLVAGLLEAEKEALERLWTAHDWTYAATITGGIGSLAGAAVGAIFGSPGGPPGMSAGAIAGGIAGAIAGGGQIMRDIAAINSIASQARSLQATYARRVQDWQYQKQLADQDMQIGDQQITLATDQLEITKQEAAIAQLHSDFAGEVINFLSTKFTNKQLYEWMARVVRGYYRAHLNFATLMARMAQQALAFERQETITYIAPYYAEREKRDLLVAERLLTDINRLDQHRLTTERRRKELTKVISLASYAPVEFQRLKRQGWMSFSTLMEWFDRDFPGHYMRLIKSISMTVVGLIPATEGVKATLSNHGISYVMVGPPFDQPRLIQRQPESIAVTAPNNGTGLFELRF